MQETRQEWLDRCIPVVLDDGSAEDQNQAVAMCSTMWDDASKRMKRLVIPFQVKSLKDREVEGYGSTFGNVDLGGDVVLAGAFQKSITRHAKNGTMPKMLWNHDAYGLPIGIWKQIEEDKTGLRMLGELADTQMGNDVRTLARMKAIDAMSIGYYPVDMEFDNTGTRLLKEIDLQEVSLVNFPMNPRAVIQGAKAMYTPRSLEHDLREKGCTRAYAREVVHELFQREAEKKREADDSESRDAAEDVLATANELAERLFVATLKLPKF